MAGQAGSTVDDPISPHLVSSVFVQQYYHILHEQPEEVHKFYQDSSILGRPEPNGTMVSVTTLTDINETIMSMDFRNCLIAIETADAQLSHKDGVLIIVTGSLTPSKGNCRRFTQSFFLAPQESGGYFVLNDVFRFLSERQPAEINQVATREDESSQIAISALKTFSALPEPTAAEKSLNSDHVTVENNVTERKVINTSDNGAAIEYNVTTEPPVKMAKDDPKRAPVVIPPLPSPTHRDVTKKSYASIVKDKKEGPPAVPVVKTTPSVPKQVSPPPKPATKDVEGPVKSSAKPAQGNETTASDGVVAENNCLPYENGYSVFVRNLPYHSNIKSVEEEFKKFGAVKPNGVQVVHNRFDGFCFGFVEYESRQSMQAAIEASPIHLGQNHVFIEKKRAPTQVTRGGIYPRGDIGEGGRFQAGRGVYHDDDFGGQGGGYMNNTNYRGGENFNHRNEGRENYNRRNDSGEKYNCRNDSNENYSRRNDSGENYNRRGDVGENFNHRNDGGENYNRRNDGSENYNRMGDGGDNNNRRGVGENYNRRNDSGENYNRRGDVGENFNHRNDGSENYNRRGDGGDNNNRRGVGENYNRRNDGGENYNRRGDGSENNCRGNMGENYNRRYDGGENYKRGSNGSENYNHRNDGGENYNHRNDGGEKYNRRNDGGENFNRRANGENFNRRNFRNQNDFSGGRGQRPPPGNGYHQNSNGFHQPRPVQNGKARPAARVNGPKQVSVAA